MTKKEFDLCLKQIGVTRQEFANHTGLTYGAVSNWNDETKPIPQWVDSWIENYIRSKDLEKIVEVVKPYIN